MTLPPRHGFNRCDGHIGRLKTFVRRLSRMGYHLAGAEEFVAAVTVHAKFENASEYAFNSNSQDILPPAKEIRRMVGIQSCTHFVFTVLDDEGNEIYMPGTMRGREVAGQGSWLTFELYKKRPEVSTLASFCTKCTGRRQRRGRVATPGQLRASAHPANSSSLTDHATHLRGIACASEAGAGAEAGQGQR